MQLLAVSPARMSDCAIHTDPQALFSSWGLLFYLLCPSSGQQGAEGRSPVRGPSGMWNNDLKHD